LGGPGADSLSNTLSESCPSFSPGCFVVVDRKVKIAPPRTEAQDSPPTHNPDQSRETPFHEIVRCLGDCRCPTRPRCWTVGRNEIADAVGDVAGSCPPLLFSCVGAAGAATGAGAPTVVAVRRPWQPWRRWSWCRLPRGSVSAAAPTSSGAARRPGEVSCAGPRRPPGPVRRVAAPWRGRDPLWCSRSTPPAHRSRSSPATPATSPRNLRVRSWP